MAIIDDIDQKANEYYKSGLDCPDFVHLSPDVYSTFLKEMQPTNYTGMSGSPSGIRTCEVYVSTGILKVNVGRNLKPGSIIIGDNPIIDMMIKLGGIFEKMVYK